MKIGAMVLASLGAEEIVDLAARAEELGFESFWVNDADVVYRNTWPVLSVIARETNRIRFGPCVTNFVTRPWVLVCGLANTLQELSGGRLELGVGRGDAAVRVLGRRPMTPREFGESLRRVRAFLAGEEVEVEGSGGVTVRTTLLGAARTPILGAGYGPTVLRIIAGVCDGAIVQAADPELVTWARAFLDEGALGAGRHAGDVGVTVAAPAYVADDVALAWERMRWFADVVARHLAALRASSSVPLPAAAASLADLHPAGGDRAGALESPTADYGHIPDAAVDAVTLAGPAPAHVRKLERLAACGVERVVLYLNHDARRATMEAYAREVIPVLAEKPEKPEEKPEKKEVRG